MYEIILSQSIDLTLNGVWHELVLVKKLELTFVPIAGVYFNLQDVYPSFNIKFYDINGLEPKPIIEIQKVIYDILKENFLCELAELHLKTNNKLSLKNLLNFLFIGGWIVSTINKLSPPLGLDAEKLVAFIER